MLYCKPGPVGLVIVIVPDGLAQLACCVTDAIGAVGTAGNVLIVTGVDAEVQPVAVFLTVTLYRPGGTLLNTVPAW
jgi:hypothetical protein